MKGNMKKIALPLIAVLLLLAVATFVHYFKSPATPISVKPTETAEIAPATTLPTKVGPGRYVSQELGFQFDYSDWWTLDESNWDRGHYLDLIHHETTPTGSDVWAKGNSKIEITFPTESSLRGKQTGLNSPYIEKITDTTVNGQKAFFVEAGEFTAYIIRLPSKPDTYISFTIYGYGTKAQLDEVVQSLQWNR